MSAAEIKSTTDQKMQKSLDALKTNLAKIRSGRANPGILEHIQVEYYGNPTPLSQVASLGLADARTINVQPFEKTMVAAVEKAIRDSDLGLNPASQGTVIRVPMPALTEERRRELTKVVKSEGEEAKIAVRNLRRDANEHLKRLTKDKEISEQDVQRVIDAAKAVDAGRYSAGNFHKAEQAYRMAQQAFEDRKYDLAKENFLIAKDFAERAENSARMLRFKNGEVL